MFCKQCGTQLDASAKFCPQCGTMVEIAENTPIAQPTVENTASQQANQTVNIEQPTIQQTQQAQTFNQQPVYQNQPMQNQMVQPLGMNWYKFIIYFQLFACAVINLFVGSMYISGEIYNLQSASDNYSSHFGYSVSKLIYEYFSELKAIDVMYGIISLGIAVFAIVVRMRLAKFKKDGPIFYYILQGVSIVASIIYMTIFIIIMSDIREFTIPSSLISSLTTSIILLVINIIYFNKRKHLFVNP